MNHPADIAFVYTHAESDCCADHVDTVVDEIVLCLFTLHRTKPGVVGYRLDTVFGQFFHQ